MKKILCILFTILLISCCKNDDETDFGPFTGVRMFDEAGSAIGCFGPCDDDWTSISLTSDELDLLSFADTIDLGQGGTVQIEDLQPYPLPISNSGNMSFFIKGQGKGKLKLVVVDESGDSYFKTTVRLNDGTTNVRIGSMAFSDLERKKIYRMYYLVEGADGVSTFTGYGDFAVCELEFNPTLDTCFN